MKLLTFSALALAASSAFAQDYQSISTFDYGRLNTDYGHANNYHLGTKYYLNKKSTLGPLDQFDYINKTSNVSANFNHNDAFNSYQVGGELFVDNVLVGGSYQYNSGDFDNTYNASLGYLISDDLLVKASAVRINGDTKYFFNTSYNYQLSGDDYVGFTYNTDNKFDNQSLSSKYFTALGQDRYLTAGVSYAKNKDADNVFAANLGYYFSRATSVYGSYANNDTYSIGAKHYIDKNYAVAAGFTRNTSDKFDANLYTVNFTAQF